ncbi:SMI1/KNR4 family protein [Kitasatospora sp. NPDC048365]|uniref:SMI1/KNR4 family protein n=1 Tax=Kitasatospora sp. NPDC048365 TaxID=3364050 RepID=UPI00371BA5F6
MTGQVEQAARRVVERIVETAPEGWTESLLTGRDTGHGLRARSSYTFPPAPARPRGHREPGRPHGLDEVGELVAAVRAARGWQRVDLEIRCRPTGAYTVTATDLGAYPPTAASAVPDPAYRPVPPGLAQEAGTAPPAGDPALAVERLHAFLRRRDELLGAPTELPPPAGEAELAAAEQRLGVALPADLRALYLAADGDGDTGLFNGDTWLPLAELVRAHGVLGEDGGPPEWNSVLLEPEPFGTVRRLLAHPGWLPFATSADGNYLAVDLAPAVHGRPGQVLEIGRDFTDGPAYAAESVTALLGRYLGLLDDGAYDVVDEEYVELHDLDGRGWNAELLENDLPDRIPTGTQAVHLHGPGPADLTRLADVPVRKLYLKTSAPADLAPLREAPLEDLTAAVQPDGLAALTGHPTLATLTLTCTGPLDLAPLRTLPALRGLDLSRAEPADPTVLADLPGLRHLALTRAQWAALAAADAVPEHLATARRTDADDTTPLADTARWAAALGLPVPPPLGLHGTVSG